MASRTWKKWFKTDSADVLPAVNSGTPPKRLFKEERSSIMQRKLVFGYLALLLLMIGGIALSQRSPSVSSSLHVSAWRPASASADDAARLKSFQERLANFESIRESVMKEEVVKLDAEDIDVNTQSSSEIVKQVEDLLLMKETGVDVNTQSSSEIVKQDEDLLLMKETGVEAAPRLERLEAFLAASSDGAVLLAQFDATQ